MDSTLSRAFDFKLVFDALTDKKSGMVQLQVLSSYWPSDEARPSFLPSNCLSLWSQFADAKGYLDWEAFSKGITKALEGFLSSEKPAATTDSRMWEEKRARNSVSGADIKSFLQSCGKHELIHALVSARKEVHNSQKSLQDMNTRLQKAGAQSTSQQNTRVGTSQIIPSSEKKELSTRHKSLNEAHEPFGERLSQDLSATEGKTRFPVPVECKTTDIDGTDAEHIGGIAITYQGEQNHSFEPEKSTSRARKSPIATHAQLAEASAMQHQRTMTLPRSSTYSRGSTRMQDPPHGEIENPLHHEHTTLLSQSMMAMQRRPSPSRYPAGTQSSQHSTSAPQDGLPRHHARHSSMTMPRRNSNSSGSPVTLATPSATDESSRARVQQCHDSDHQSNAKKTHRRSHSLASCTKQVSLGPPASQPGMKVASYTSLLPTTQVAVTRTPTHLNTTTISLDSGPISDL